MFPKRIRDRIRQAIWGDLPPDSEVAQRAQVFTTITMMVLIGLLIGGLIVQILFGQDIHGIISILVVILLTILMFGLILYIRSQRK